MKFNNIFMSSLILGTAIFATTTSYAQSGIVTPKPVEIPFSYTAESDAQEIVISREYDAAHLIKNKKQIPTYIEVKVANFPGPGLSFKIEAYIRDVKSGKEYESVWTNSGSCVQADAIKLVCTTKFGSIFTLSDRKDHVTLEIPKGRALALVESGSDRRLILDGNDEDNRSFWLFTQN
ncbi:MAG: hypothetical protein KA116_09335 [Proteobacteria bacterium]|nr:hypothetical protein [Pseudomonadota bacterium]